MRVNPEEIDRAKETNLIHFLSNEYPDLIVYDLRRRSYCHADHDSLIINDRYWYRFSTSEGGDQIEFLKRFCGKKLPEAVRALCDFDDDVASVRSVDAKKSHYDNNIDKNYKPPTRGYTHYNMSKYLQERSISWNSIQMLMDQDLLYEDFRKNCVFQRKDPGMCILRGTRGEKWTKIIREIPNNYWFFKVGEDPSDIFICESPIDAISLYECNKCRDGYYCAMGGLKRATYSRIIDDLALDENLKLCKNIKIAVDWDDAGRRFLDYTVDSTYKFIALYPSEVEMKRTKDWNDVLQLRRKEKA